MAETTNRPKPKPRPKPRPAIKAASSSSLQQDPQTTTPIPSSSSLILPSSPHQNEIQDEDERFMRNRTRTFKGWKKLEEINKGAKVRNTRPASSDSDEGGTPPRPRKQKKRSDQSVVPRWQKDKKIIRLLSQDVTESDSDSDAIQVIENTLDGKHPLKRKRTAQSRSRSITPPPALPIHQLQNARNVVRQTLDTGPRSVSPSPPHFDPDDSTDTIILAPELARIAQAVHSNTHQSRSQLLSNSLTEPIASGSTGLDVVTLRVKWQPHPSNEAGKPDLWAFKMNSNDNFRELFDEVADLAAILSDSLIMSYKGKRLFSSATPNTLRIFGEAELVACDKATYDYLRTHSLRPRVRSPATLDSNLDIPSENDDDPSHSRTGSMVPPNADAEESDAESTTSTGDKFKLILRSAITTKNITLTVRPTTTCGAIVKAFLKSAGLADKYPNAGMPEDDLKITPKRKGKGRKGENARESEKDPKLSIDGEKLESGAQIGDADLEDGDMVEVVDL